MIIPISILVLGVIGIVAAILLYIASKKFKVYENPVIGEIEEMLPGANCGGCGFSGCHAFAVECASATTLEGLYCNSLGNEGMQKVATILGLNASKADKKIAVVKCGADCVQRKQTNLYDGVNSCTVMASFYQGESACVYGCLGCGDCVRACPFEAMSISNETRLPEINFDKCTGCGKCVEACPRKLCTLVSFKENAPVVWVACSNKDKGPLAMKECELSCIGCSKCRKVCPTEAPAIASFLAEIDQSKCISCGRCIKDCPRHCISSTYPISEKETLEVMTQFEAAQ